ncbi:hypothetical protein D3C85_1391860 [compost metagenome]
MTTPTELSRPGLSPTVPTPRIRAVVEASDWVEVTVMPGVRICRSLMSRTPAPFSASCDRVVTTIGTSCRFCSRFWAVTMMSSIVVGPSWADAAPAKPKATAPTTATDAVQRRMVLKRIRRLPGSMPDHPRRPWRFLSLSIHAH